jgi:hypothetical protein
LSLIADFARCSRHFAFVPLAEVAASFDYLVSAGEKWRWYFEPDRTGSLCIDDELETCGLIERNFSGGLADRR